MFIRSTITACATLAGQMVVDEARITAWYHHWIATAFASLEIMLAESRRPTRYAYTGHARPSRSLPVPQMANARRFGCDLSPYPRLRGARRSLPRPARLRRRRARSAGRFPREATPTN